MSAPRDQSPSHSSLILRLAVPGLLAGVAFAIYGGSFDCGFVFDGEYLIVENSKIHGRLPPLSQRWVGMATFAVNYALHRLQPWGYHLVNVLIHVAAALTLFGIVHRTLRCGRLAERYAAQSAGLALAVALIWLAHPLQTQAVTYLVQRQESLMALFYLLALDTFIRAQDASPKTGWYALSIVMCSLGMMTKEVAATAPLVILWYDRVFVAQSWREIQRRWWYYAGLSANWVILGGWLLSRVERFPVAGVVAVENVTPLSYALSQPGVILRYLQLTFWPAGQCIDPAWPVAQSPVEIVPPLLAMLLLLGFTVGSIWYRPEWSFLGAAFFLVLAPSSSIVPIKHLYFEHRMYLPLAAVVSAAVLAGDHLLSGLMARANANPGARRAVFASLVIAATVALGWTSRLRARVYTNSKTLWTDVAQKAPHNPVAYYNLGEAWLDEKEYRTAVPLFRKAIELHAEYAEAHGNLGNAHLQLGDLSGAERHLRRSVELDPDSPRGRYNLGMALYRQGKWQQAARHLERTLQLQPDFAEALNNLGLANARLGHREEALRCFRQALDLNPELPEAHLSLGNALLASDPQTAITHFRRAIALREDYAAAYNSLGVALLEQAQPDAAAQYLRRAVRLEPSVAMYRRNLADALAKAGGAR